MMRIIAVGVVLVMALVTGLLNITLASSQTETECRQVGTSEPGIMALAYNLSTGFLNVVIPNYQTQDVQDGYIHLFGRDNRTVIDADRIGVALFPNQTFDIPTECDVDTLECTDIPITIAALNLIPMSGNNLPHSQHIARVKSICLPCPKPLTVTRMWLGQLYDIDCLVSQSLVELYQLGEVRVGDYVIVSFIDENPNSEEINIPVAVDKVYESWN